MKIGTYIFFLNQWFILKEVLKLLIETQIPNKTKNQPRDHKFKNALDYRCLYLGYNN